MKYLDQFLEYLQVQKKYSTNTISSYYEDIKELFQVLNTKNVNLTEEDIDKYLKYLYDKKFNKNSIARKLSGVRGYYNYLLDQGIVQINYFNTLSNPKRIKTLPHYLKDEELQKMLAIPNLQTPLGQRNRLILEMLYATGVRVSELVNIKIKDINQYDKSIKIFGKGRKSRIVFYGNYCQEILSLYLKDGRKKQDKNISEYLFLNKNGNKLTTRTIRNIIDDIILKSNLDKKVYPHMLRHSFATEMLNNGSDLISVKELLGHESINTTSIYTHVTDEQVRKVYETCHPRSKEQ